MVAAADGLHLGTGATTALAGHPVTSTAVDRGSLWALTGGRELHRLAADGSSRVASLDGPDGTCVHVHEGTVYVGGHDAGLWELQAGSLHPIRSFQEAPGRAGWHTPWGGPPSVLSMASHGDDLYVGVHVGGILRSADGAATWTATIDLHDDVHQVDVDPDDGTVWAATGRRGLAERRDRGGTWRYHVQGLHRTYLLVAAVTTAGVVVGASAGHADRNGVVYLFDGSDFQRVEGLPDSLGGAVGPRHIAADGDQAALVTPDGDLYVSVDGGHRWSRAGGPFASPAEVAFTARTAM